MTDIGFYHLTVSPLERTLPRLLEKILAVKKRAVILCATQERLDFLNAVLWTGGKISFIPHGSTQEGFPEDQPIWLTLQDENPNGAEFLIQIEGAESPSLSTYKRCLDLFDGADDAAVMAARNRWAKYKASKHAVTYWTQTPTGEWEKRN